MALAWAIDEGTGNRESQGDAPARLHGLDSGTVAHEAGQPKAAAATDALLSVLVADDEESLRGTLCAILEQAGHRVVGAEDGQVALRLLNEQQFDVLILDLAMPKTDGVSVLRQIEVPPPVVIVYSAFAYFSVDAVHDGVGAKVFRYMQKPVSPLELLAAVHEAASELDR